MIYKYHTEDFTYLFKSLKRYFKYVLNNALEKLAANDTADISNCILFISQEEKENPELLKLLSKNRYTRIVLLGFDNNSSVNLIDLPNLKNNLLSIINNPELSSTSLFSEDEVKDKLKNFFKGHGEESLLDGLNWSRYYFLNGPLLLLNSQITGDEYRDNFLESGGNYWDSFKKKFYRFNYHLIVSGLEKEIKEIKRYIEEFDKFREDMVMEPEIVTERLTEDNLYKNIDLLKKIDNILSNLANQFGLADVPIQTTYN